jgi:hypothetical protein
MRRWARCCRACVASSTLGRKRLFPEDTVLTKFELVEGQPTSSGALIATYRPIR